jgi:hypothetical protein
LPHTATSRSAARSARNDASRSRSPVGPDLAARPPARLRNKTTPEQPVRCASGATRQRRNGCPIARGNPCFGKNLFYSAERANRGETNSQDLQRRFDRGRRQSCRARVLRNAGECDHRDNGDADVRLRQRRIAELHRSGRRHIAHHHGVRWTRWMGRCRRVRQSARRWLPGTGVGDHLGDPG